MPHERHSKRSEKTSRWSPVSVHGLRSFGSGSRVPDPGSRPRTIANAAPPPSRYEVSIESVRRLRTSPSTRTRSTTTSRLARFLSAARSISSNATALPSTSRRPKPRRRSPSIVSPMLSAPAFGRFQIVGFLVSVLVGRRRGSQLQWRPRESRSRSEAAYRRAARQAASRRPRSFRESLPVRTAGNTFCRLARTAVACSRGFPWSFRPSNADFECCSSGGSQWRGRCLRCGRRPASPCARGTAAHRPTTTRRIYAAPPRRSCRRRATTSPTR